MGKWCEITASATSSWTCSTPRLRALHRRRPRRRRTRAILGNVSAILDPRTPPQPSLRTSASQESCTDRGLGRFFSILDPEENQLVLSSIIFQGVLFFCTLSFQQG